MKRLLFFVLLLGAAGFAAAEKLVEFTHIFYPKHLIVTGDKIYIADYPMVHIQAARDFSHLKELGGEGQGPGEFYIDRELMNEKLLGLEIFLSGEKLYVNSMGRLSIFSADGELLDLKSQSTYGVGSRFRPLSSGYVGFARDRVGQTRELFTLLNLYDKNLKKIKEISRVSFWLRRPGADYDFFERAADSLLVRVYKDRIFVVKGGGPHFEIDVLDAKGTSLYTIRRDVELLKLGRDFIERVHEHYKIKFKRGLEANLEMTVFPEYFPPIRHFTVADDRIYVITYRKNRSGNTELVELDLKGNPLHTHWIPIGELNPEHLYPFAVHDGFFYQLKEDENMEKWELHRWALTSRDLSHRDSPPGRDF
jgi:hypothetical protein